MIISAMSVISPYGVGADAFGEGVRSGRSGLSPVEDGGDLPYRQAGTVDGFDVWRLLGQARPDRSLSRPGGLAVGAVALLLREHDLTEFTPDERGLVLGGDLYAADRAMDIMHDSLTQRLPYQVDVKQFPASVLNHPAAQCAIRFQLRGPNSTVAAGRVTGLVALNYARRVHRAGRAPAVLVGAVEEFNPRRAWISWYGYGDRSPVPLGEGCCVFLTESRWSAARGGRRPVAEVLALELGTVDRSGTVTDALAGRIRRALAHAGVDPAGVRASAVSGVSGDAEHAAVTAVLGEDTPVLYPTNLIGDTDGAAAAFQLAAVIASLRGGTGAGAAGAGAASAVDVGAVGVGVGGGGGGAAGPDRAGGHVAVVTAVDPDGQLGCGVFRILPA